MVVAPGRMIDSFLSIPDAESLPLYRMVLKLACVCVITRQATSPRELPSYTVNSHHNTEKLPSYTLSTVYIPGMTTLILSIYRCIPSYDGICEYMRVQNILTKCA